MTRRRRKRKPGRGAGPPPARPRRKMSRREWLATWKLGLAAAAVLGGGGYLVAGRVMAGIAEGDLSRIGNGTPAIVQVHDPGCPSCLALQNAARDALCEFDAEEIQYLVANLDLPEGRRFAARHGAGRVTLLLFDGTGRMRRIITGRHSAEELERAFRGHLAAAGG